MSPRAVLLAAALLEYARDKAYCWPSVARLAEDMNCSRRTIQIALANLVAAEWVRISPADNPTHRILVLTWRTRATDDTPALSSAARPPAQQGSSESLRENEREKERSTGTANQGKGAAPSIGKKDEKPTRRDLLELAEGDNAFTAEWARALLRSWHADAPDWTIAELHQLAGDASNPALQAIAHRRLEKLATAATASSESAAPKGIVIDNTPCSVGSRESVASPMVKNVRNCGQILPANKAQMMSMKGDHQRAPVTAEKPLAAKPLGSILEGGLFKRLPLSGRGEYSRRE